MRKTLISLLLLTSACSQAPKKQYRWTSLSEKGFTETTLTVLKEDQEFQSDKGFEGLEIKKRSLQSSPLPNFKKIVLIGDTGCRLKENKRGDFYQNCKDNKAWAYQNIIEKIAAEKPDLILHFGDYHYREQCSEGKICRQYTNVVGKGWRAWEADFFHPSQKALAAAPWIFIRGNHEDCDRSFEGYRLLSEQKWGEACIPFEKTEYLVLGDLLLVHLDSSSVSDKPESPETQRFFEQEFKNIEIQLEKTKARKVWLITHKPVIALFKDFEGRLQISNINLQKAFAKTRLAERIDLLFAGHIHNSQFVQAENFPKQIVVGNSGTVLDEDKLPKDLESLLKNKVDEVQLIQFFSDTHTAHSFGYAVMSQQEDQSWQLQFKDADAKVTFTHNFSEGPALRRIGNVPEKPKKEKKKK